MTDNSSDLSDGIVPEVPQHTTFDRSFAPWHKVRKEFVRKKQWNRYILRYAQKFLTNELQKEGPDEWVADEEASETPEHIKVSSPLRCLVIPGDDLLDIRSLWRDTEEIECYIRYLGFNERQGSDQKGTRVYIAHNDVVSLNRIHNDSRVLCDRFQTISKPNSQAYRFVKEFGPFHVVNLDLCDSLFPTESGDLKPYYEALHRLSAFQMQEMATPWLLFLTTEVAPNEVDTSQFDSLCEPTKQNVKSNNDFKEAVSSILPTAALNVDSDESVDCAQLNEEQLVNLFGIAIGKALLSFCSSADPQWKISMLGSHTYTINQELKVSMLSLAFQFTPVVAPPQDATGISGIELPQKAPFNESTLATKLVTAVENISDIDNALSADPDLMATLTESSATLLESAGYNREAYNDWVQSGEQS